MPIPAETEAIVTNIIGCAITVHRTLGPGFLERIYREAMCLELKSRNIPFEREVKISVEYRGAQIPGQRVDFIVAQCVIVELKAVVRPDPIHEAKVISYLRTTKLRVGLLINFHCRLLKDGLQRIVV